LFPSGGALTADALRSAQVPQSKSVFEFSALFVCAHRSEVSANNKEEAVAVYKRTRKWVKVKGAVL